MKKKIMWGTIAVLGIALSIGLYMFVRYEIKVYNTLLFMNKRISVIDDFLTKNFKEEVNAYLQQGAKPLPANAPVAPKQ